MKSVKINHIWGFNVEMCVSLVLFSCVFAGLAGCANEEKATAVLTAPMESGVLGDSLAMDASESVFDTIEWYQDDVKLSQCEDSDSCLVLFSQEGVSTIKIKVQKSPSNNSLPVLGDLISPSEDTTDETDLQITITPTETTSDIVETETSTTTTETATTTETTATSTSTVTTS
ncbi:MAG: hypothetical protein HQM11_20690, partial [SAR324 cluster bacterium]|nr:hypothetical protein [SAR324 cluster bacterium]